MRFNFANAMKFIIENLESFKEIGVEGSELFMKIKQLWEKYQQSDEPIAMGSEASSELNALLDDNPAIAKLAFAACEPTDGDAAPAMTGPGTAIAVLKFLVTYGPLIKQIIDAWRESQNNN